MTTVLETRNLRKEFGELIAVDDVNITVDSTKISSIIGPNGAGKTTFYNLLSGHLVPTDGEAKFLPRGGSEMETITGLAPYEISRLGLARGYQITNLFDSLSVFENICVARVSLQRRNLDIRTRVDNDEGLHESVWEIIELVGLVENAEETTENLSHGDKRKVEIAIALATDPSILLLDEPTAGMTLEETKRIVALISELDENTDTTFMLTEHDMQVVFDISDHIIVLHKGQVIFEGEPEDARHDDSVVEAYLGSEVA